MDFVGRKKEIAAVKRSLTQGRNVVLHGRFGVGRSRLSRHFAKLYSDTWQFLFTDFSKTASQSCNDLVHQLIPHRGSSRRNRYTRIMYAKDILLGKKLAAVQPRVVVLDNIGKISRQKLTFIRDMRFDSGLLFIAIAESFLSEAELFRLRSALYPSDVLFLHNLGKMETVDFFRYSAQRKKLNWDENFIHMLAASSEGYPLLMRERLFREIGVPSKKNTPIKRKMK